MKSIPSPRTLRLSANCTPGGTKNFFTSPLKYHFIISKGLGLEAAIARSILPGLKNPADVRRTAGPGKKKETTEEHPPTLQGICWRKRNKISKLIIPGLKRIFVRLRGGHAGSKLPPGPPTWPGDYGCINSIRLNIRPGRQTDLSKHRHGNLGPSLRLPHSCQNAMQKYSPVRPSSQRDHFLDKTG